MSLNPEPTIAITEPQPPASLGVPGSPPAPPLQYPAPQPAPQPPTGPGTIPPPAGYYTEEQVQAERQRAEQLAQQAEQYRQRVEAFEAEKKAQADAAKAQREAEANAEHQRLLEESDAKTALKLTTEQWEARWAAAEQERAQERLMAQKEQEFLKLEAYKSQVLAQNAEQILPRLQRPEMLRGNSVDEINESVRLLVEASAGTMQDLSAVQGQAQQQAPGVAARAPGMGPEAFSGGQRQLTLEEIRDMPMSEYAKIRNQLGPNDGAGRGMF